MRKPQLLQIKLLLPLLPQPQLDLRRAPHSDPRQALALQGTGMLPYLPTPHPSTPHCWWEQMRWKNSWFPPPSAAPSLSPPWSVPQEWHPLRLKVLAGLEVSSLRPLAGRPSLGVFWGPGLSAIFQLIEVWVIQLVTVQVVRLLEKGNGILAHLLGGLFLPCLRCPQGRFDAGSLSQFLWWGQPFAGSIIREVKF